MQNNQWDNGTAPPRRPTASSSTGSPPRRSASGQPQRRSSGGGRRGPENRENARKRRVGGESRWFRAIVMVMGTVGLCVFLAIFLLQSANDLFGLNQQSEEMVEVVIPEGATISQIASILSQHGVVDKALTFQVYAGLKITDEDINAGTYPFNSTMSYDEIIRDLRTGIVTFEEVRITFIEGNTAYEIAKRLEENEVCSADEFLNYLDTGDFDYEFMDLLPNDDNRYHRMEGYIFPDTYDFYVGEKVESVADKFLRNFDNKITDELQARMLDLNLTLDETITLASIIQKEAGQPEVMRQVSSVFHNRLNLPEVYPKLQSDVTKIYVNNFIKPFMDYQNQELYDSYNTYECDGLPVGPICNPGMDAIEATLNPADTNYYFFVTDVQDQYYYAETAQEHYDNVYIASRVDGEGEIHGTDTE